MLDFLTACFTAEKKSTALENKGRGICSEKEAVPTDFQKLFSQCNFPQKKEKKKSKKQVNLLFPFCLLVKEIE